MTVHRVALIGAALLASLLLSDILPVRGQQSDHVEAADHHPGIRPGDVIRIRIWRERDFSGEFTVLQDSTAVLPRLGPWPMVGKSPRELQEELVKEYEGFLRNPSIEIVVLRRVRILGEVSRPGLYTLDPTVSITDALAEAGGITANASKNTVILVREGRETELDLDEIHMMSDLALHSGDELYVPPRNWLVRNIRLVSSLVAITATLLALFLR